MTRGDVVVVASRGAYTSMPRPAVVVQADDFNATHASVTICPITSDCVDAPLFRVPLPSTPRTGLSAPSQVMVDKIVSVPREAIGQTVGRCQAVEVDAIADALRRWLAV
jgi:mRNA interferase MazF